MSQSVTITVNGTEHQRAVEPRRLLSDFLREDLNLTGTHVGCDTSQCGCCTVLLDATAVKSCSVLAVQADWCSVDTVEGLADATQLHPLQKAFSQCHGLQCGFCTPGMLMSAVALLQENPLPDTHAIRRHLEGNLCRCTGYINIENAIVEASKEMTTAGQAEAAVDIAGEH